MLCYVKTIFLILRNYARDQCKFSGNCLNSGLHEAQIPALIFIFSPFWRLLAQIHALFQAFALWSAYIPVMLISEKTTWSIYLFIYLFFRQKSVSNS